MCSVYVRMDMCPFVCACVCSRVYVHILVILLQEIEEAHLMGSERQFPELWCG